MAEYLVEHRDQCVCVVLDLYPVSRHTGCYEVSTGRVRGEYGWQSTLLSIVISVCVCCVRSLPVSRHTGCYEVSTGVSTR